MNVSSGKPKPDTGGSPWRVHAIARGFSPFKPPPQLVKPVRIAGQLAARDSRKASSGTFAGGHSFNFRPVTAHCRGGHVRMGCCLHFVPPWEVAAGGGLLFMAVDKLLTNGRDQRNGVRIEGCRKVEAGGIYSLASNPFCPFADAVRKRGHGFYPCPPTRFITIPSREGKVRQRFR